MHQATFRLAAADRQGWIPLRNRVRNRFRDLAKFGGIESTAGFKGTGIQGICSPFTILGKIEKSLVTSLANEWFSSLLRVNSITSFPPKNSGTSPDRFEILNYGSCFLRNRNRMRYYSYLRNWNWNHVSFSEICPFLLSDHHEGLSSPDTRCTESTCNWSLQLEAVMLTDFNLKSSKLPSCF